jgi:hypothetical protein
MLLLEKNMLTVLLLKKTGHHSYSTYRRRENTINIRELVMQTTTIRPLSTMATITVMSIP